MKGIKQGESWKVGNELPLFDGVCKLQKWVGNSNQTQLKPIVWYTSWYFSRGVKNSERFARHIKKFTPSPPTEHLFTPLLNLARQTTFKNSFVSFLWSRILSDLFLCTSVLVSFFQTRLKRLADLLRRTVWTGSGIGGIQVV